jgi:MFS family permease
VQSPAVRVQEGGALNLWASCLAMLAVGINGTAVMAALPTMQRDFAFGPTLLQWVVNAYLVTSAACIIVGGKAADRFGAGAVAIAGVLVFGIASVVIATVPVAGFVVAGRALQGIGAALAVPATLALAGTAATSSRRAVAIGAWTGFLMLGFSVGPLVGGVLTHFLGWRTIFWSNAAIILISLPGFLLDRRRAGPVATRHPGRPDWLGFFLLAASMTGLIFGLQALPTLLRRPIGAFAPLIVATAALIGLRAAERRVGEPLVDFGFFGLRNFVLGCAIGSIAMLGIITFLLYYNLFAQGRGGLRFTPIEAGISLLPMSAAILSFALSAPALAGRFGMRVVIGGGMLSIIGAAALIRAGAWGNWPIVSGAGLFAMGGGLAAPYACAPRLALSVLSPGQAGQGSGIISACTFLGGSIGVACGGIAYGVGGFSGVLTMLTAAAVIGLGLCRGIANTPTSG